MTSLQNSSVEKISCNVATFFYHHSVVIQHLVSDMLLSLNSKENYIYILRAGTFRYSQHALNYNFISEPFTGMKKSGSRSSFKGLIHSCKPVTFCLLFEDFFIQVIVLTVLVTTYIVFIQI
jgi:hypothetical protein